MFEFDCIGCSTPSRACWAHAAMASPFISILAAFILFCKLAFGATHCGLLGTSLKPTLLSCAVP